LAAIQDVHPAPTAAAASILVEHGADPMAEALRRGLLAAGFAVAVVPTVFDAVVEAARSASPRHFVVAVDFFGQQEFRLFPLVRREWPDATIVAYHSAGFEHKGRLAELVGADVVLASHEEVIRFIEGLAPSAPVPASIEESKNDSPLPPRERVAEGRVRVAPDIPLTPALSPQETGGEGDSLAAPPVPSPAGRPVVVPNRPSTEAMAALAAAVTKISPTGPYVAGALRQEPHQPTAESPTDPNEETFIDGEVVGTMELTEEELRLLLGEEEGA